jgi:hypothetical protein
LVCIMQAAFFVLRFGPTSKTSKSITFNMD